MAAAAAVQERWLLLLLSASYQRRHWMHAAGPSGSTELENKYQRQGLWYWHTFELPLNPRLQSSLGVKGSNPKGAWSSPVILCSHRFQCKLNTLVSTILNDKEHSSHLYPVPPGCITVRTHTMCTYLLWASSINTPSRGAASVEAVAVWTIVLLLALLHSMQVDSPSLSLSSYRCCFTPRCLQLRTGNAPCSSSSYGEPALPPSPCPPVVTNHRLGWSPPSPPLHTPRRHHVVPVMWCYILYRSQLLSFPM